MSLVGVLSGCVSNAPMALNQPGLPKENSLQAGQPIQLPPPDKSVKGNFTPINITPFTQFSDGWSTGDFAEIEKGLSGMYTRLIVSSNLATIQGNSADQEIALPYEIRSGLARFIVGKDYSLNLTAKVTAGSGGGLYKATVPLMTITHQSNWSVGEQFTRVVYHSVNAFPLFLINRNGTAVSSTVEFNLRGADEYSSRVAGAALQIAVGVAQTMAAQPSVITSLTSQAAKNKADALDKAVGQVFSKGIDEQHWTDRDMREWRPGAKKGAVIQLRIPQREGTFNVVNEKETYLVGNWILTFDYPRPSIFVDWYVCKKESGIRCQESFDKALPVIHKDLRAPSVLSYSLIDSIGGAKAIGTIGAYIQQQPWFTTAQAEMIASGDLNDPKSQSAATGFCRNIRNLVTSLNLNDTDADIVVWAVWKGIPTTPKMALDTIANNPDCRASIEPIELDKGNKLIVLVKPTHQKEAVAAPKPKTGSREQLSR